MSGHPFASPVSPVRSGAASSGASNSSTSRDPPVSRPRRRSASRSPRSAAPLPAPSEPLPSLPAQYAASARSHLSQSSFSQSYSSTVSSRAPTGDSAFRQHPFALSPLSPTSPKSPASPASPSPRRDASSPANAHNEQRSSKIALRPQSPARPASTASTRRRRRSSSASRTGRDRILDPTRVPKVDASRRSSGRVSPPSSAQAVSSTVSREPLPSPPRTADIASAPSAQKAVSPPVSPSTGLALYMPPPQGLRAARAARSVAHMPLPGSPASPASPASSASLDVMSPFKCSPSPRPAPEATSRSPQTYDGSPASLRSSSSGQSDAFSTFSRSTHASSATSFAPSITPFASSALPSHVALPFGFLPTAPPPISPPASVDQLTKSYASSTASPRRPSANDAYSTSSTHSSQLPSSTGSLGLSVGPPTPPFSNLSMVYSGDSAAASANARSDPSFVTYGQAVRGAEPSSPLIETLKTPSNETKRSYFDDEPVRRASSEALPPWAPLRYQTPKARTGLDSHTPPGSRAAPKKFTTAPHSSIGTPRPGMPSDYASVKRLASLYDSAQKLTTLAPPRPSLSSTRANSAREMPTAATSLSRPAMPRSQTELALEMVSPRVAPPERPPLSALRYIKSDSQACCASCQKVTSPPIETAKRSRGAMLGAAMIRPFEDQRELGRRSGESGRTGGSINSAEPPSPDPASQDASVAAAPRRPSTTSPARPALSQTPEEPQHAPGESAEPTASSAPSADNAAFLDGGSLESTTHLAAGLGSTLPRTPPPRRERSLPPVPKAEVPPPIKPQAQPVAQGPFQSKPIRLIDGVWKRLVAGRNASSTDDECGESAAGRNAAWTRNVPLPPVGSPGAPRRLSLRRSPSNASTRAAKLSPLPMQTAPSLPAESKPQPEQLDVPPLPSPRVQVTSEPDVSADAPPALSGEQPAASEMETSLAPRREQVRASIYAVLSEAGLEELLDGRCDLDSDAELLLIDDNVDLAMSVDDDQLRLMVDDRSPSSMSGSPGGGAAWTDQLDLFDGTDDPRQLRNQALMDLVERANDVLRTSGRESVRLSLKPRSRAASFAQHGQRPGSQSQGVRPMLPALRVPPAAGSPSSPTSVDTSARSPVAAEAKAPLISPSARPPASPSAPQTTGVSSVSPTNAPLSPSERPGPPKRFPSSMRVPSWMTLAAQTDVDRDEDARSRANDRRRSSMIDTFSPLSHPSSPASIVSSPAASPSVWGGDENALEQAIELALQRAAQIREFAHMSQAQLRDSVRHSQNPHGAVKALLELDAADPSSISKALDSIDSSVASVEHKSRGKRSSRRESRRKTIGPAEWRAAISGLTQTSQAIKAKLSSPHLSRRASAAGLPSVPAMPSPRSIARLAEPPRLPPFASSLSTDSAAEGTSFDLLSADVANSGHEPIDGRSHEQSSREDSLTVSSRTDGSTRDSRLEQPFFFLLSSDGSVDTSDDSLWSRGGPMSPPETTDENPFFSLAKKGGVIADAFPLPPARDDEIDGYTTANGSPASQCTLRLPSIDESHPRPPALASPHVWTQHIDETAVHTPAKETPRFVRPERRRAEAGLIRSVAMRAAGAREPSP